MSKERLALVPTRSARSYEVRAFCVDPGYRRQDQVHGRPVVETVRLQKEFPPATTDTFVAIGYSRMNRVGADIVRRFVAEGYSLALHVSPRSHYLPSIRWASTR